MSKLLPPETWRRLRPDFFRALALIPVVILIWCTLYDRWTVASWETPLVYAFPQNMADVMLDLGWFKAASGGHIFPLLFTNVPQLGTPHIANWDDYPLTEKPLICATGLLANFIGLFAAANVAVMIGQVLAAVSFYVACRMLNASWVWSASGALIFAFSRFFMAKGLQHITVAYCWHLPLCLVVCAWIFRGEGIRFREWRYVFALAVAFVTGVQNVYYTNLFAQLILFGGLLRAWRGGWKAALPAAGIIGMAAAAFLLMNANTLVYALVNGGNDQAVVRSYQWLEFYGLKLVDLVMPPPDHPLFADWSIGYLNETILSPGELPPSGYLGLAGLGAMAWLVIVSLRRTADRASLPLEAWLVLWIFLYAEVGGLNGLLGTLGFQLFRATTRYSIVILCIVLMYAVRQLSSLEIRNKFLVYGAALLGVIVALWEQTPPLVADRSWQQVAAEVASDRNFTEKMEKELPANAMIFQLPVMDFPENPGVIMGAYDHFRPYLFAKQMRFSFGSDKGRPQDEWQHQLMNIPIQDAVAQLESYGFSALYLNLNGFDDKGEKLIAGLKAMGRGDMFLSESGDLLCVRLKPSAQPVSPDGF